VAGGTRGCQGAGRGLENAPGPEYGPRIAMRSQLLLLLFGLSSAAHAAPPELGYAQASNYFKKDARPTQYQPLNLVDGRESTAWCSSSADPLVERLTFGFKDEVRVDEVRVYTGNGADEEAWKTFARAKKLAVKGQGGGATLNLRDERGLQSVALKTPLTGVEFSVEVLDLFPADDFDQPTCISDVVFYSEGKPLNGGWLAPKLKYDRTLSPLLGTWYAGSPRAPTHFLSLYVDGTWRYAYEPWDAPRDARQLAGTYDVSGSGVTLNLPDGAKLSLRGEKRKGGEGVALEGAVPDALKHPWRGQP
jgi:hypothetical protein